MEGGSEHSGKTSFSIKLICLKEFCLRLYFLSLSLFRDFENKVLLHGNLLPHLWMERPFLHSFPDCDVISYDNLTYKAEF